MLELFEPFTGGRRKDDASFSIPTDRSKPKHDDEEYRLEDRDSLVEYDAGGGTLVKQGRGQKRHHRFPIQEHVRTFHSLSEGSRCGSGKKRSKDDTRQGSV